MEIKLPIKNEVGLGDAVKKVTDALKIPQCGGCKKRQEALNNLLSFGPRADVKENIVVKNNWTKPPELPEGWKRIDDRVEWNGPVMVQHESGKIIIWQILEGQYKHSHSFCEKCFHLAQKKWAELAKV